VKSTLANLESVAVLIACSSVSSPILVFGDIMLDAYLEGEISRISPEAPVPVLSKPSEERYAIGGAGNVANNLRTLGDNVRLVTGVGDDEAGQVLTNLIKSSGLSTDYIARLERKTTKKKRIIAGNQQVLRIDSEDTFLLSKEEEDKIMELLIPALDGVGAIVVSDYAKGILTKKIVTELESYAEKNGIPLLVDTKLRNLAIFSRPSLIKPNLKEAQEFTGIPFTGNITDIEQMAVALYKRFSCKVVITCGGLGMVLHDGSETVHLSGRERQVFDVSGAGDTVISSLAHCILRGMTLEQAASFAVVAAGIAISRKGTVAVQISEVKSELDKVIMPKVWGHEEWIVNSEYCGKKLVLNEGYCCSLHYHKIKDETFYIALGKVGFQLNDEHFILTPGDSLLITPGTKHRFYGLEHSEIFEFSTHHMEDDSYRDEESGTFEKSFFNNVPNYHSK
jgi:rfaE bifunctional protein kinase chain/domain